jgi:two-component system, sensor histidine kinase and response regulator
LRIKLISMSDRKDIRILVAEDDFLVGQEIIRTLNFLGYQKIDLASNGEKAVAMAQTKKPDIILMDIEMPRMNGIEAARIISQKLSIPIVILTAHESHDYIEQAVQSGVGAYLTKPARPEEIERAFAIAIARHQDILMKEALIKELEKNRIQLNEAIATKDKFFKIIAHDLKNPVFGIQGLIELLDQNFDEYSAETKKELIHAIKIAADKISDLLMNLLHWARMQDGSIKNEPEKVALSKAVLTAIRPLEAVAKEKSIKINIELREGSNVYADLFMLTTILRNLISNAIKFTNPGGEIKVSSVHSGKFEQVSIKDNGIGMNESTMARLFRLEEGFTTSGTSGEAGSGLGLILCKEFIESNHGTLSIKSEPNLGSNFIFTVPLS